MDLAITSEEIQMDPAIMQVMITNYSDAISLVVYFATATWLLKL